MILIHSFLDLPPLSDTIIESAYSALNSRERENRVNPNLFNLPGYSEYKNRILTTENGKKIKSATGYRYWIGDEFAAFVLKYFEQDDTGSGVNVFEGENTPIVAPHIDASRSYSIHYVLDKGGDSVDTIWWKEKEKSLLRRDLKGNFNLNDVVDHYNRLEEISRIRVPEKKWILMNVDILHSVEFFERPRISIQVSRDDIPKNIKLLNPVYVNAD